MLLEKSTRKRRKRMIDSYIALDLETTGLNPAYDRIIEIGMARVEQGCVTQTYTTLINPGIEVNERVVGLTGIHNEELKGMPRIEEKLGNIIEFIGNEPILGHNIIFDYSFLKKAAVNNNIKLGLRGIDTLKMARRILPELEHKRLDYLCEYLKINPGNSHRALDDAISASSVYWKLYEIKPEDSGFDTAAELVYNVKKDSPITKAQRSYLSALVRKHNVKLDIPIEEMTKSTASRNIDKIISEYGK